MSFKDKIEILAAVLTVILSIIALWGILAVHKRGFFKTIGSIADYYHDLINKVAPKKKGKK